MEDKIKFDHWAIVEVFGHDTYAGRVSEETIGGSSFVRLDVPEIGEQKAFTKFFGNNAIYSLTIVEEEAARLKAASLEKQPISTWEVRGLVREAIDRNLLESKLVSDGDDELPI